MNNISGFGLKIRLIASTTFPIGFDVTEFADDSDPFDIPSLQVGDTAMGLNGDLITWSKANPIKVTLAVVPGSTDDLNLAILLEANRPGKGKSAALDTITLVGIYPDGRVITFINGAITDGMPGNAVSSDGRQKSKVYNFAFENRITA